MNRIKFLDLMLIAAIALLAASGFWLYTQSATAKSVLQIGFVEPDSLKKMPSLTTNRLPLKIHNPSRTVAKIVGNNAC